MLISSSTNLHFYNLTDISAELYAGLRLLRDSGFDAADLSMKPLERIHGSWDSHVEQLIVAARELEIPIKQCHLPFSVEICKNPDLLPPFCERMRKAIDAAKMLGVDYAVLHPSTLQEELSVYDSKKWRDRTLRHLEPFAEYAAERGVALALENMPVYSNNGSVDRYCSSVTEVCEVADNLGLFVCFDFGHANIVGAKMSEAISYIGGRLKVLHVNDNLGSLDDHLPIGEGNIDWQDAISGLNSIGFSGLFNYEINATGIAPDKRYEFAVMLRDRAKRLLNG